MSDDHGAQLLMETNHTITLGTLAAGKPILQSTKVDASRNQGWYAIWMKISGFLAGKTVAEGALIFGICANLNADELEAILEDDPQGRSKPVEGGAGSWYYPISTLGTDQTEGDVMGGNDPNNVQGVSVFTKIPVKWAIPEGQSLSTFIYNKGSGALTTGATVALSLQHFGAWLRD